MEWTLKTSYVDRKTMSCLTASKHKMEDEVRTFTKVWTIAMASGLYCYALSKSTQNIIQRLLSIFPIIILFTLLPFSLSTVHLGGFTAVYLIWLANFKLVLFAFGLGPLQEDVSLSHFILTLLLPVKARPKNIAPAQPRWLLLAGKIVVFGCVLECYKYRKSLPYGVVLGFYCLHVYIGLEMIFAVSAVFAWASSGLEITPQFNHPYFTTSLQDFWGHRWNLMVSDILRLSVHNPIRSLGSQLIGRKNAVLAGILASFLVSGLMHELVFYHLTRVRPTWEVTWFFILHGVCTVVELIVKKAVPVEWGLPPVISRLLTIGFVAVTANWLFFPQFFRNGVHEKAIDEYPMMLNFFKRNVLGIGS